MAEILIDSIPGWPPIKNEALSLFSAKHGQWPAVVALLTATRAAIDPAAWTVRTSESSLGLELVLRSPEPPPGDATNYLGGIGDVLEGKSRRGSLPDLGELADVALYDNDRSIHEARYIWIPAAGPMYAVRLWDRLDPRNPD